MANCHVKTLFYFKAKLEEFHKIIMENWKNMCYNIKMYGDKERNEV